MNDVCNSAAYFFSAFLFLFRLQCIERQQDATDEEAIKTRINSTKETTKTRMKREYKQEKNEKKKKKKKQRTQTHKAQLSEAFNIGDVTLYYIIGRYINPYAMRTC